MVHNTRMCTREKCIIGIGKGWSWGVRSPLHLSPQPKTTQTGTHRIGARRQTLPCGDNRHRSTARSLHRPLTAPSIVAREASHVHAVLHAANIVQRIESRWQLLSLAGSWSRTTFAVVRCSVQDKRASRTLRLSCSKGLAHRP